MSSSLMLKPYEVEFFKYVCDKAFIKRCNLNESANTLTIAVPSLKLLVNKYLTANNICSTMTIFGMNQLVDTWYNKFAKEVFYGTDITLNMDTNSNDRDYVSIVPIDIMDSIISAN